MLVFFSSCGKFFFLWAGRGRGITVGVHISGRGDVQDHG